MTTDYSAQKVGDKELETERSRPKNWEEARQRILEDTHALFPELTRAEALHRMKCLIDKHIEWFDERRAEKRPKFQAYVQEAEIQADCP